MDKLIRLMVGRDLSEQFPKEVTERGQEMLRVEGLWQEPRLRDISFSAYAGEVLGIAGLVGAGRTELVRAIFGADPIDAGRIYVKGKEVRINSPQDAVAAGIGLLTEDRKQQGLCLHMNVRDNVAMAVLGKLTPGPVTNRKKEASLTQRFIQSLNIKASSQEQLAINLSGGTQQKVVLSKWLATGPSVLIFDEPTRGIDVGAKVEIYKLINDLARQGVAILMISSELPEVLGMSDRIMVIGGGRVRGFLSRARRPKRESWNWRPQPTARQPAVRSPKTCPSPRRQHEPDRHGTCPHGPQRRLRRGWPHPQHRPPGRAPDHGRDPVGHGARLPLVRRASCCSALEAAAIGIVAAGQTFVILTGGIDLSVEAMVSFSGVVAAILIAGTNIAGGQIANGMGSMAGDPHRHHAWRPDRPRAGPAHHQDAHEPADRHPRLSQHVARRLARVDARRGHQHPEGRVPVLHHRRDHRRRG